MFALQYRRNPLQPHTGVDRGRRQRVQHPRAIAVVLHEHEIPDFDVSIEIIVRRSRWAARHIRTMVVKNFRRRSARACVAHLPEVVFVKARQTVGIHTNLIDPYLCRFIIGNMDRYPKLIFRKLKLFRQKGPCKINGFALEVITKAEISQHFEKSMVSRGVTNILKIVVLTARTNAALT